MNLLKILKKWLPWQHDTNCFQNFYTIRFAIKFYMKPQSFNNGPEKSYR